MDRTSRGVDERYEAAKDLLLEAFKLREPQLDENSIHLIDTGLALGIAYQALEMPEEANLRLDAALGSLEFGKFGLASIMDNLQLLANILREQGDEKRAEEVLQLSLSISEEQHFEDWRTPQTLSLLAGISMGQQQPAKAKEQLLEAYRIVEECSSEAERCGRSTTHNEESTRYDFSCPPSSSPAASSILRLDSPYKVKSRSGASLCGSTRENTADPPSL